MVENHSDLVRAFKLHEVLSRRPSPSRLPPKIIPLGDGYDYHWKLSIGPGRAPPSATAFDLMERPPGEPVVEGLDAEIVTGARVI